MSWGFDKRRSDLGVSAELGLERATYIDGDVGDGTDARRSLKIRVLHEPDLVGAHGISDPLEFRRARRQKARKGGEAVPRERRRAHAEDVIAANGGDEAARGLGEPARTDVGGAFPVVADERVTREVADVLRPAPATEVVARTVQAEGERGELAKDEPLLRRLRHADGEIGLGAWRVGPRRGGGG